MIPAPLPVQLKSPFHMASIQAFSFDDTIAVWSAGAGGQSLRDTLLQFWADASAGSQVIFDTFDNIPDGGL
jgi:hypothetical protein